MPQAHSPAPGAPRPSPPHQTAPGVSGQGSHTAPQGRGPQGCPQGGAEQLGSSQVPWLRSRGSQGRGPSRLLGRTQVTRGLLLVASPHSWASVTLSALFAAQQCCWPKWLVLRVHLILVFVWGVCSMRARCLSVLCFPLSLLLQHGRTSGKLLDEPVLGEDPFRF